jgi:putative ABC transport system permease protein
MVSDLGRAFRYLWGKPRFAVAAVTSLALGIAATTAIFTFVHAVLLADLPFPNADRLIAIEETDGGRSVTGSPQRFRDWLRAPSVERMAAYYSENISVRFGETPERIPAIRTFGDPLETLNVQPVLGRGFTEQEKRGGGAQVAVITNALWRNRFGGDSSVIGRKVELNGGPCEIVGVLPAGARLEDAEIIAPEPQQNIPRDARFLEQIGRLRPGVELVSARAEIHTVAMGLRSEYPATDAKVDAVPVFLRDHLGSYVRLPLLMLLGAVGCLLAMTASNTAMLSVSQIAERTREISIRRALGASRLRIGRMVLAESAMLAGAGGIVGLVGAIWAVDLLRSVAAAAEIPRLEQVKVSMPVVGFAFLITALVTVIAGLLPALYSASGDVNPGLQSGGRSTRRSHGVQAVLTTIQVALAVTLLIGGGLLFRTLWSLEHRPMGFAARNVATFRLPLPWQMGRAEVSSRYARAMETLRSLPGVTGVALTDRLPLGGPTESAKADVEGRPDLEMPDVQLGQRTVSAGFHQLMRVPLLAGRYLEEADAPHLRTVINQAAARRLFPQNDALGKRIGLRWRANQPAAVKRFEIVGVVGDLPEYARTERVEPAMYIPFQQGFWPLASFVVESDRPLPAMFGDIQKAMAEVDGSRAIEGLQSLDDYVESRTTNERVQAWMFAIFSGAALLLAATGVYGLAACRAAESMRAMAIRVALGATPQTVLRTSLQPAFRLAGLGAVFGLAIAAVAARQFRNVLFGVAPLDLPTYVLAALVLIGVAILAAARPATRLARMEPVQVLRMD